MSVKTPPVKGVKGLKRTKLQQGNVSPSIDDPQDRSNFAMNWPAAKTELRRIETLSPHPKNARTHSPEQIGQIGAAIRQWGWTNPILVTADGTIIAGHGRALAAKLLDLDMVPVIIADGWSNAQIRAYVIADNKLAENAGWDRDLLATELADLQALGFEVHLIGFSIDEMADLALQDRFLKEPDEAPEVQSKPVSRMGDVWLAGEHRILCGDSTQSTVLLELLEGFHADACWTDPPYNVAYKGAAGTILNDDQTDANFLAFLEAAFSAVQLEMKPGAPIYVAHSDTHGLAFRAAFAAAGFRLKSCLIWRKNALVLGRSDYQWQHEPILYGWKPGAAHPWFGGRKATTIADLAGGTVFGRNADGSLTIRVGDEVLILRGEGIDDLEVLPIEPTVIECGRPRRSELHPTMKPVELIERMLKNSTRVGDLVVDPFGGSGSTLMACEVLSRKARLVELDPRYVDVIVRRWQEFTGRSAILAADGRTFDLVQRERGS